MLEFTPSLSLPLVAARALASARVRAAVPVLVPRLLRWFAGAGRFRFAAYRLVVSVCRRVLRVHHPSSWRCASAPSVASVVSPLLLGRVVRATEVGCSLSSPRRGSPRVPVARVFRPSACCGGRPLERQVLSGSSGGAVASGRRCWLRAAMPNPAVNTDAPPARFVPTVHNPNFGSLGACRGAGRRLPSRWASRQ